MVYLLSVSLSILVWLLVTQSIYINKQHAELMDSLRNHLVITTEYIEYRGLVTKMLHASSDEEVIKILDSMEVFQATSIFRKDTYLEKSIL